jgi:hypothetical protein
LIFIKVYIRINVGEERMKITHRSTPAQADGWSNVKRLDALCVLTAYVALD